MRPLITLFLAAAVLSMLAGPAFADDHYPVEVAPIIVERPEAPGAIPPAVPPADVAPGIDAPAVAPAVEVPAPAQVGLAVTGLDITVGLLLALGLVGAGGAALWTARRRRLLHHA